MVLVVDRVFLSVEVESCQIQKNTVGFQILNLREESEILMSGDTGGVITTEERSHKRLQNQSRMASTRYDRTSDVKDYSSLSNCEKFSVEHIDLIGRLTFHQDNRRHSNIVAHGDSQLRHDRA